MDLFFQDEALPNKESSTKSKRNPRTHTVYSMYKRPISLEYTGNDV